MPSIRESGIPFPEAVPGQERHVISLPPYDDAVEASHLQVQIIPGKVGGTNDGNKYVFSGQVDEHTLQGWGYVYYVANLGDAVVSRSSPAAVLKGGFVPMHHTPVVRYNSKVPIVVYVPSGAQVRYKVWADETGRAVQGEAPKEEAVPAEGADLGALHESPTVEPHAEQLLAKESEPAQSPLSPERQHFTPTTPPITRTLAKNPDDTEPQTEDMYRDIAPASERTEDDQTLTAGEGHIAAHRAEVAQEAPPSYHPRESTPPSPPRTRPPPLRDAEEQPAHDVEQTRNDEDDEATRQREQREKEEQQQRDEARRARKAAKAKQLQEQQEQQHKQHQQERTARSRSTDRAPVLSSTEESPSAMRGRKTSGVPSEASSHSRPSAVSPSKKKKSSSTARRSSRDEYREL